MKRILLLSSLLALVIGLSSILPYSIQNVGATHKPYDVANCIAAGQGPDCASTVFIDVGSTDLQSWDPAHDYEFLPSSVLDVLYDPLVEYTGANISISDLAPTSAIASIDVANGTYYQFTIRTGIHAWRLNGTTPVDLGEITASDWVFSIKRAVGECAPDGPAPVVYPFIYNSSNWFNNCLNFQSNPSANQTALLKQWNNWLASEPTPIGTISPTKWFIRVDGDQNATNDLQPYGGFLGILAQSWAGVYPQKTMEQLCGALTSHLDLLCDGTNGAVGNLESSKIAIGTGPYLLDEVASNSTQIILRRNENYCQGGRTDAAVCAGPAIGGPLHSNRAKNIIFTAKSDESARVNDLYAGKTDFALISAANYGKFLNSSSTPTPYDELLPNLRNEYNFSAVQNLVVQHMRLLVHRTSAGHQLYGVSPLEGECSPTPSPGCLVRKGIIAAFNYAAYIKVIIGGLGRQIASFIPEPFTDSERQAVLAGVLHMPTQNLAMANELFQNAGYNNTRPLNFTCAYNVENVVRQKTCGQLASDLATLKDSSGKRYVFVSPVTGGFCFYQFYCFDVNSPQWDVSVLGWAYDYADEDDFARPYAASSGYFMKSAGYLNATLDDLIVQAGSTNNLTQRRQLYFQIMRTVQDDCQCYIFLSQPEGRTIWVASVSGFNLRGTNPAFLAYYKDLTKKWISIVYTPTIDPVYLYWVGVMIIIAVVASTKSTSVRRQMIRRKFQFSDTR